MGIVSVLGLLCVTAVVGMVAVYSYTTMKTDMYSRAESTKGYFAEALNQSDKAYYQSCITYTQTFEDKNTIELQFIDTQGDVVASSYGSWIGEVPNTPDISDAMTTRGIGFYTGKNPATGERIMAVSNPMIYTSGEVAGVLRYVTSTRLMDQQILSVALIALGAMILVVLIVLFSSNYYIRTVLTQLGQITDKAKKIANGSYGIQIETPYDDEIGDLAQAINEMSIQINQNEKTQSEFISSLSHELRTPLTAITGWSETILDTENLDKGTQRGIQIILREAKRLTEMVVELLDFTRIQSGRMTLNMETADLRAEFEDTVYMYGSRLAQDGIKLECLDNDDEIPEISCDPKRLRQVLLNILDNAAKHGGEGGRIEASITYENEKIVICVRDYGPGIPEDELPLVKKKFYKGSSKVRGSGIGLAVSDEIVSMHGGELTLANAPGGGTIVTVSLPVSQ